MRRWMWPGKIARTASYRPGSRCMSAVTTSGPKRVGVRCGSAGSIYVDSPSEEISRLPSFCSRYATAVINYRWSGFSPFDPPSPSSVSEPEPKEDNDDDYSLGLPLNWPMPVHDTLRAYEWIIENLNPVTSTRRDVYVFGSYLGASLAASLALTETHSHHKMGVRGFAAYNGIYNWTTFLPDHHVNKQPKTGTVDIIEEILGQSVDPTLLEFKHNLNGLFGSPADLFDPFASPCLFFQTPGLLIPDDFNSSADPIASFVETSGLSEAEAAEAKSSMMAVFLASPPKRSALIFPPRKSTLKIPQSLLLHSPPPPPLGIFNSREKVKKEASHGNHFRAQAENLAGLMRRSLEKFEMKDRIRWDPEFDACEEISWKVQLSDVGADVFSYELPTLGNKLVSDWLEDQMGIRTSTWI